MKSVYCAVRTGSLNKAVCASYLKGYTFAVTSKIITHTTVLVLSMCVEIYAVYSIESLPEYFKITVF